jgi:hypothetical protein
MLAIRCCFVPHAIAYRYRDFFEEVFAFVLQDNQLPPWIG